MNEGQQKFFDFIMARVQPGKEDELKAILSENFKRQDAGTFSKDYLAQIMPKMISLLRPETIEEFKQAAAHMGSQLK